MTKWKLLRQSFGNEEFTLTEGEEVTVGRAVSNTITLSSIVISRFHCVLKVEKNNVLITDLKSSNGVYVGLDKIPPNKPYTLKELDIVGIGWTIGAPLANISDEEKYVFKICKEKCTPSLIHRIKFQNDKEMDNIEEHLAALEGDKTKSPKIESPIGNKLSLKRKAEKINIDQIKTEIKEEKKCRIYTYDDDVVDLLSESENEMLEKQTDSKGDKIKLEQRCEESNHIGMKNLIKCENDFTEYEAFDVKQEYLGYDDEPIKVDSDSDSESEHWYLRLSQSSPGKPFTKLSQDRISVKKEDSSYSQMDDDYGNFVDNEEEFLDDLITIPVEPLKEIKENKINIDENEDIIYLGDARVTNSESSIKKDVGRDKVDGFQPEPKEIVEGTESPITNLQTEPKKKVQMIEPLMKRSPVTRTKHSEPERKTKHSSSKHSKVKKHSSRRHISNSQKEERKKKLRAIASKEKEFDQDEKTSPSNSNKPTVNIKSSSSNRGAFLTDTVQVVKPVKRKDEPIEIKTKHKIDKSSCEPDKKNQVSDSVHIESRTKHTDVNTTKKRSSTKSRSSHSTKSKSSNNKSYDSSKLKEDKEPLKSLKSTPENDETKINLIHMKPHESAKPPELRVPLKSLKPLTESDETYSGKPFSKVEPLPPKKPKKTVRFADGGPRVHIFEIEPGNRMKKTSMVKATLLDTRKMPVFSLEKITLMKILRWNPHWLEEQINNNEPPPILGHNNPPMSIFHSYVNHHQYVQLVGDLLLMEIWECLSLAYLKIRNQSIGLQMRIGALPPVPTQERCYELYSLSVNISVLSNGPKIVPRVGEIILMTFGPENAKTQRFFYVNNVRCLPSPPNNIHSFYSVSLHSTFTDKMRLLRQGEVMIGVSLAYINKELNLFEAMEYLAGSPLSEFILKPEPRHFQRSVIPGTNMKTQWTKTLNPSQHTAVTCSVSAALGDKPSIQMVQGPPGTGKSSVICAIVMTYFYDQHSRRQQNRGKILICATSNAAVDELVIRLLNIRQNLPKSERFRMVRVGRAEAMHARARDVSSQQLAQRDAARLRDEPAPHPGTKEEISHLEAKINMWKTQSQDAKDPVRVAYCQGRISDLIKRITLMRSGGVGGGSNEELRPDQLIAAEKRIIEGADIIVTTLASAHNHKMKGLKRRIALCIIDEAGQAIEPETLIPLTLDVSRLTLIGDPQQLPGYICSQRAKKHGLGESMFSRLTSSTEQWAQTNCNLNPVVLLNQQYRMHPDIADYPNRAFYGGKVISSAAPRPIGLTVPPYVIVSISSGDKGQGSSGANEMEAWGVSRLVTALNTTLRPLNLSLAVITPYNAHKDLIKKHLRTLQDPSEHPVEVNTVDSFQGQERDVVVVSLARSQGVGFLTDAGRMNVMLTRAKHALIVALNPQAMLKNHQWRTLVEDAQKRNMYRVLPNKMCQPNLGSPHDDILKYIANK